MTNRYYDFRDTFDLGAGFSTENSCSGMLPPALGVYLEATDFAHLGAITHYGYIAETDMRGSGVYYEERCRMGFGPWQALHLDQDYANAAYKNYFKTPNTRWERWMKSSLNSFCDAPAKELVYTHWAKEMQYRCFMLHRGYQYWEYMGAEAAICDPFLTHFGFYLRAGFDVSEVSDFLLGWTTYDFKHDDLNEEEFNEKMGLSVESAAAPAAVPGGVPQAEYDRLKAENDRLAKELAECQGKLRELGGGIEIELPESVFFDTGKATLRAEGRTKLAAIISSIKAQYPGYKISVQGHTDNRPVVVHKNLFKSNWELGSARSNTVVHFMEGQGVSVYSSESYADNKPVADNGSKEGRQANRRAVIVLRAKK
jgi:chemotaxis protein MotB